MTTTDAPDTRNRKAEQSDRTRAALIEVARTLFAQRGYAATPTEEIVQSAGVTRGALYHHFRDKQDLFETVYRELQDELRLRVIGAYRGQQDPRARFRAGFHEYLNQSMDPAVQRIILIDAPSVLGWERWRAIDAEYVLGLLRAGLERMHEEGLDIDPRSVEYIAHLLLGVASEASHLIAGAGDAGDARREIGGLVDRVLDSLLPV